MLSGGADGSIKIWDLESCGSPHRSYIFKPIVSVARVREAQRRLGHTSGVSHLDFHPRDPESFISSSFDHSLKVWSVRLASVNVHFEFNARIYSHAASPIAGSTVVACATHHSSVRLVDLRTRSIAQSLPASGGAILDVCWSPRHERVLASGHADGKVRIWDTRRTAGPIGQLDMEDSLGIIHRFEHALSSGLGWDRTRTFRAAAQAHSEAVNALTWTDDGAYIISAGLDGRIRVWNAATGANTLAGFGSGIQNRQPEPVRMFVSPTNLSPPRGTLLFWPNELEILAFDLHEGHTVSRLRVPGAAFAPELSTAHTGRITALAWRGCGGKRRAVGRELGGANAVGGIYTAHADGHIKAWMPRAPDDEEADDSVDGEAEDEDTKKRKRKVLDDAFRSLTGRRITFTDPS
jgi:DNA excision repair protein ERCC-8